MASSRMNECLLESQGVFLLFGKEARSTSEGLISEDAPKPWENTGKARPAACQDLGFLSRSVMVPQALSASPLTICAEMTGIVRCER